MELHSQTNLDSSWLSLSKITKTVKEINKSKDLFKIFMM